MSQSRDSDGYSGHVSIDLEIDNFKTFIPSYEKDQSAAVPFTPPSLPEKLLAGVITATVWTGIIFTLPGYYLVL